MREEKQNKEASNEDGTTIIAEIVGGLLKLFQEFLKNIETQIIIKTRRNGS